MASGNSAIGKADVGMTDAASRYFHDSFRRAGIRAQQILEFQGLPWCDQTKAVGAVVHRQHIQALAKMTCTPKFPDRHVLQKKLAEPIRVAF